MVADVLECWPGVDLGPRLERPDLLERMGNKFLVGDGCWEWTAATTGMSGGRKPYGVIGDGWLQKRLAHRALFELMVGLIPDGYELDHLCRNTLCVRPDHLEPVRHHVNCSRGEPRGKHEKAKTHCPQGHPYDEVNTYVDGLGHRHCRICKRAAFKRWQQKAGG